MDVFLALSDPTRRKIVDILAAGPLPAGDISSRFNLSPPAISQHLKVLRETRMVAVRSDAQRRIYQIDSRGLREVDKWLGRYRKFWMTALDELQAQMQTDRDSESGKKSDSREERRKKSKSRGRKK